MNVNIDAGNRIDGWINVDPFCKSPRGSTEGKVEEYWMPSNGKAKEVKIYRVFERLKDKLHNFMIDIRKCLADDGVIKLYAIRHDDFQKFLGGGRDYLEKCFGPYHEAGNIWVQDYKNQHNIIDVFEEYGFKYVGETEDEAEYPCYGLKFMKNCLHVPTEYFSEYLPKDDKLNTVDIGPGNHPWKLAKNYIEHPSRLTDERYKPENMPTVNVIFGDLEKGIPEIKDKQFDFAFASHIFEHLKDPVAGAKELSRIAKRGIVIVPSAYKDAVCYWEEWEHRWDIFPPRVGSNKPRFVLRNEDWLKPLKDQEAQAIMCRLYRYQSFDTREERYIKRFFIENEQHFDVLIEWNDEFQIETI